MGFTGSGRAVENEDFGSIEVGCLEYVNTSVSQTRINIPIDAENTTPKQIQARPGIGA